MAATLPRRWFLVSGPAKSQAISLTFDDGPHPEYTPRLLDALSKHQIHACFFLIGKEAERFPDLVRRIAADGHAIGHHSFSHSDPRQTPARQLMEEVQCSQELFIHLTGRSSTLFRPPFGKLTAHKLWRLWRGGMTVVLWNRDPRDYARHAAQDVRDWLQAQALNSGDVVLLHDTCPFGADIIPDLAAAAGRRGLRFASVDEWAR
jgi:peptidoglycan/xylan/chitin deacetylase (PgdA/CDA1 family)